MDFMIAIVGFLIGVILVYFLMLNKLKKQYEKNNELTKINFKLETKITTNEQEIKFINNSKQEMESNFKILADQILNQNKQELNTKNLETLNPLERQIKEFKERLEVLRKDQFNDSIELKEQIKNLASANEKTVKEAEKLTNALTYDNKHQGDWGEMVLEKILQGSGLKKDQEYEVQKTLKNDDGNRFKPDIILHLPDGKDIVIDAKVSLVAYRKYIETNEEKYLKEHIDSIKKHVKNISLKEYENLDNVNTLDFIFVFFPIEASLLLVLEKQSDLFSDALNKNVALVSPSTLIISLKTVHHIWKNEKQNKNTEEISRLAGAMYDKLAGFVESLDSINNHLEKATNSYNDAKNRLNQGKGNVFNIAGKIKELGVTTRKQINEN
jgi:DNA recombination protein RmuC